jgi:topoisomerase IV subunit B
MDPAHRTILQVTMEDAIRSEETFTVLMGDKVEPRRKWIETNVAFGLEEESNILDNENMSIEEEVNNDGI